MGRIFAFYSKPQVSFPASLCLVSIVFQGCWGKIKLFDLVKGNALFNHCILLFIDLMGNEFCLCISFTSMTIDFNNIYTAQQSS